MGFWIENDENLEELFCPSWYMFVKSGLCKNTEQIHENNDFMIAHGSFCKDMFDQISKNLRLKTSIAVEAHLECQNRSQIDSESMQTRSQNALKNYIDF